MASSTTAPDSSSSGRATRKTQLLPVLSLLVGLCSVLTTGILQYRSQNMDLELKNRDLDNKSTLAEFEVEFGQRVTTFDTVLAATFDLYATLENPDTKDPTAYVNRQLLYKAERHLTVTVASVKPFLEKASFTKVEEARLLVVQRGREAWFETTPKDKEAKLWKFQAAADDANDVLYDALFPAGFLPRSAVRPVGTGGAPPRS